LHAASPKLAAFSSPFAPGRVFIDRPLCSHGGKVESAAQGVAKAKFMANRGSHRLIANKTAAAKCS
jgi:hypothetical protein